MHLRSLVLLPGLDGTGLLFQPLVECLPDAIEPVVVSYPPDQKLGYEELLPLVLERLPAAPFVLLGESFSGPLAVMAAATAPPGLGGLILAASFVRSPVPCAPAWCRHLIRPFQFRRLAMRAARLLIGQTSGPALRAMAAQAASTVHRDVLAHRVRAVLQVDVADLLARCAVPILYLQGAHDRLVPGSAMRGCLRANPAMRCVTLPAPHMVLQTRPREAAQAIHGFVRDIGDG